MIGPWIIHPNVFVFSKFIHCDKDGMLYRQYGWLCVWLLCRLYCSNAIVSLNCYKCFCAEMWASECRGSGGDEQGLRHKPGLG